MQRGKQQFSPPPVDPAPPPQIPAPPPAPPEHPAPPPQALPRRPLRRRPRFPRAFGVRRIGRSNSDTRTRTPGCIWSSRIARATPLAWIRSWSTEVHLSGPPIHRRTSPWQEPWRLPQRRSSEATSSPSLFPSGGNASWRDIQCPDPYSLVVARLHADGRMGGAFYAAQHHRVRRVDRVRRHVRELAAHAAQPAGAASPAASAHRRNWPGSPPAPSGSVFSSVPKMLFQAIAAGGELRVAPG